MLGNTAKPMTRFQMEYNGELGEFWARHARDEIIKLLNERDDMEIESDGAAKWKSNGNYLPEDVCEKLVVGGAEWFSPEATAKKRDKQTREFISRYRKQKHIISDEELYEMRAAFGRGTTVVDVISGEKIQL